MKGGSAGVGAGGAGGAVLSWGATGVIGAGGGILIRYGDTPPPYIAGLPPTTNVTTKIRAPRAGVIQFIFVELSAAFGAGVSCSFTVYVNGAATAVTVTIADPALTGSAGGFSVAVAQGDSIEIGAARVAGVPAAVIANVTVGF